MYLFALATSPECDNEAVRENLLGIVYTSIYKTSERGKQLLNKAI